MKQAENKVKVEGILAEMDLKKGTTGNGDYISGEIKVLVKQEIDGIIENIEVPVNMFAMKMTKAGKESLVYKSIEKAMDTLISIAACGSEEGADRVRITQADIRINEFYNQNDVLISQPRLNTSFITKIKAQECNPEASFQVIFVVGEDPKDELKDGIPTGRVVIKGIIPQYNDKVDVVDFIASNPVACNQIKTFWKKSDTVRAAGKCHFSSKTEFITEELGFGEPVKKAKTNYVREFIITSGSPAGLDADQAYDINEIAQALKVRQNTLNEKRAEKKEAPKASTTAFGF